MMARVTSKWFFMMNNMGSKQVTKRTGLRKHNAHAHFESPNDLLYLCNYDVLRQNTTITTTCITYTICFYYQIKSLNSSDHHSYPL